MHSFMFMSFVFTNHYGEHDTMYSITILCNNVVLPLLGHEPDNLRVSSGWGKECCYFLIPIYICPYCLLI